MFTLLCWILGETTNDVFSIQIERHARISDLAKAIIQERKLQISAANLKIFSINISEKHIDAKLPTLRNASDVELEGGSQERNWYQLNSIFRHWKPKSEDLDVIILIPSGMKCHLINNDSERLTRSWQISRPSDSVVSPL
jgi:Crinkler effector protein N-terminal domain